MQQTNIMTFPASPYRRTGRQTPQKWGTVQVLGARSESHNLDSFTQRHSLSIIPALSSNERCIAASMGHSINSRFISTLGFLIALLTGLSSLTAEAIAENGALCRFGG